MVKFRAKTISKETVAIAKDFVTIIMICFDFHLHRRPVINSSSARVTSRIPNQNIVPTKCA